MMGGEKRDIINRGDYTINCGDYEISGWCEFSQRGSFIKTKSHKLKVTIY